ncbi:unnamed protein product [Mytilus coruscus]|uniref:Integrase catalytic domain-containing protein n=1 Tax=Mytilus coruscus TaxID=42192 RepID=A0A6J8EUT3_MYTCO|nr:unnamed protein product [Mytilus coruscus]
MQLSSATHFMKIEKLDIIETNQKINNIIFEMHRKRVMDDITFKYLSAKRDLKPGRLYLLPKLHRLDPELIERVKQNSTLYKNVRINGRPIVSLSSTALERIGKYLDKFMVQGILFSFIVCYNNYKDIIDYLETGRLPKDKDKHRKVLVLQPFYFLHDDIKRFKRGRRDLNANIQLAIPRKMVPKLLAETHNSLFSGHLGISRTIRRTQRLLFWPLMNSDIENWIKSCELCSERKQPPNPVRAQLSSMPFERVSTDIMGPLPVSGPSKYQYVLVFICYFTKYVKCIPLSTVAKAFIENVLCRHGSPSFLHSDRGSNYLSNIVRETI